MAAADAHAGKRSCDAVCRAGIKNASEQQAFGKHDQRHGHQTGRNAPAKPGCRVMMDALPLAYEWQQGQSLHQAFADAKRVVGRNRALSELVRRMMRTGR